jgi:hypothetical protein
MWLRDADDPLTELSGIARAARSRGLFFDVCPSGGCEGEIDVRVSLCPVDLCLVGIKEIGEIPAGRCVFDLIPQETAASFEARLPLMDVEEMGLPDSWE